MAYCIGLGTEWCDSDRVDIWEVTTIYCNIKTATQNVMNEWHYNDVICNVVDECYQWF